MGNTHPSCSSPNPNTASTTRVKSSLANKKSGTKACQPEKIFTLDDSSNEQSASGSSGRSSTKSRVTLNPVGSFKWIEGRRYMDMKGLQYRLPLDEKEVERLEKEQMMLTWAFQSKHMAPVQRGLCRGERCLDVGCGTSSWTMEMASEYPRSKFIGIDITDATFPFELELPSNLQLMIQNALEKPLPFPDNDFYFVYQRLAVLSYQYSEWPGLLQEMYRILKPGGWVELCELDIWASPIGPPHLRLVEGLRFSLKARGMESRIALQLSKLLKNAGFTEIKTHRLTVPMYPSQGRLGALVNDIVMSAAESLGPWLSTVMGMNRKEFAELLDDVRRDVEEKKTNLCFYSVYGRKPGGEAENEEKQDKDAKLEVTTEDLDNDHDTDVPAFPSYIKDNSME
ncbi:uncharacterized protein VTP21DRAFT_465 [Calcarisporiella thermophila]|uniref:uncharacterized protein n=1 Tax=Calcarisporiella thermophila TaxID=911321 RepID=UPI0037428977